MGWWSATVLGGDEPMDYLGDLEEAAGIVRYPNETDEIEYTTEQERVLIDKNLPKLVRRATELDSPIAFQVLGAMIIRTGAKLRADVRKLILEGISGDEWAREGDPERKRFMQNFRRQVRRYPLGKNAKPRVLAYEGLFDKLAEAISSGKPGLINK